MAINQMDFDYIRKLVRDRTALVLSDDKQYLIEFRLSPVLKDIGMRSMQDLVTHLRISKSSHLQQRVIEALVTTETLFFRDNHPFAALRQSILPQLIRQRQSDRKLHIWCAACSSGQEPYSIAMLIREHFPELASWQLRLMASDISNQMLERAKTGYYSQHEVNRGVPKPLLDRYFQTQGKGWQLSQQIRQMVDFQQLNLAAPWPQTLPVMDMIFMRNVLIYFDAVTKKAILKKVRQSLRADGYLFLGGGETTLNLDAAFEPVQIDNVVCFRLRSNHSTNTR
ncbi:MAG: protein-glutamate O-methyltransferase CheR [Leptolyngbyaceae cyanobacterium MAG.088]|nr:protein-glutamate O-methyltransferase CheR [Leptolyngbyaceae cyanobacterium MAG.088]